MLEYLARFVVGGLLVCIFALISQMCVPKQFAGIFSTAPSVLLAGLAITLVTKGAVQATLSTEGAVAGALGMILYCIVVTPAIKRHQTLRGSLLSLFIWFFISFGAFTVMSVALKW
jgi:hypothetical protein